MPDTITIDTSKLKFRSFDETFNSGKFPSLDPPLPANISFPVNPSFYLRSSLPASFTTIADTLRQFYVLALPQSRLFSLPGTSGSPITGAGATSIAKIQAALTVESNPAVIAAKKVLKSGEPPPPISFSGVTSTQTGNTLTFSTVTNTDQSIIDGYQIYRNTTNNFSTASVLAYLKQTAIGQTHITFTDTNVANGQTFYYWVKAVTANQLTSLPLFMGGVVSSPVALTTTNQLASTFNQRVMNTKSGYTSSNPLTQSGTTTTINIASSTIQFGQGSVTYNSGSVNPGTFGTWYVFAADSLYAGGAVTYQATATQTNVIGDNLVTFGQITTVSTGGATGSGGGGGGCFTGNVCIKTSSGWVRFDTLQDEFEIINVTGRHKASLIVHKDYSDTMIDMGNGELVTVGQGMGESGGIRANDYFSPDLPRVPFTGTVYNMHVHGTSEDAHYIVKGGGIAHNVLSALK